MPSPLSRFTAVAMLITCAGLANTAAGQGAQDFTYGSGGVASVGSPTINEAWNDIRLQPDGKVVVAGTSGSALLGGGGSLLVARLLPSGALDTTFNGGGTSILPIAAGKSIALQPDGKILVAGDGSTQTFTDFNGLVIGQTAAAPADITIARLNADGTLDFSFGNNGLVRTDFAAGGVDTAERLILLPSGKFWVIGAASTSRGVNVTAWSITAYNANGTLDATFGNAGRTLIDFGQATLSASAFDAIMQGDKVVIAGTTGSNFAVARVNNNGQLDATFGTGGVAQLADPNSLPGGTLRATSVIALPDGRLFANGNYTFFDSDAGSVSTSLAFAVRLSADGQPDPTFTSFPFFSLVASAGSSAAVSNGRVVIGVSSGKLIRLNEDGSRDNTFGNGGIFQLQAVGSGSSVYSAENLLTLPDGRLLAAGSTINFVGGNLIYQTNAAVTRVDVNGSPTPPPPPAPTPPAAPTNVATTSITATRVALSWRDNANNETAYIVERSLNARFTSPVQLASLAANTTTFADSTVAARTTYYYRVTARNAQGSAASPILSVTTPRR